MVFWSWKSGGDFDVLAIRFDGNCLTGFADVLQIQLNGFFDVLEHFCAGVALRDAAGQRGDCGYVPTITFALKNHCLFHVRNSGISAFLFIVFPSIKKVKAGGV